MFIQAADYRRHLAFDDVDTMPSVFPQQFNGKPLLLNETAAESKDDYSIRCAGHLVGRIMRSDLSGAVESWLWTITGPYIPPALQPSHGRESTLVEAKVAFRSKFDAWRAWAQEQAEPVPWHGHSGTSEG